MRTRELGTIAAELAPSKEKGNPRNSEGAFITLKDGAILFVYSRFKGRGCDDWRPADIWGMVSRDGGRSFGEERALLTCEEEHGINIMSLSLLTMENGDIGLFYLVRHTRTRIQMFLRRSGDDGKTWGPRVLCTPQEGFFVVNNDRVVRLNSGRILIPAACHRAGMLGAEGEASGGSQEPGFVDGRSEVMFFWSDDDGNTWQASEGKCCMPYGKHCRSGLQEPGVVELAPGILWGFARTDLGRQYEMVSVDNGNTWTAPEPSRFTGPNSPLSMKRDPAGNLWAVWNPVPEYNGRETANPHIFTGGRTPYVVAVSRDNGRTFTEETAFETEEDCGYCYCAIYFLEEGMLLGYNAGGPKDESCLTRARIRRISGAEMDELRRGRPVER